MTRYEARLTAALALFMMLLVWLIEFRHVLDFSIGAPQEATGRIVACEGIGVKTGGLKWKKEIILLTIDKLGNAKLAFTKPAAARQDIAALCAKEKAPVRVTFQVTNPPFADNYRYWLRAVTDLKAGKVIFSQADREAYKRYNRKWAYGILAFSALAFLYAAGVQIGLISSGDVQEFKRDKHHGYQRGQFIDRSSERRFSAFAYLFFLAALGCLLLYAYFFKQREIWLVPLSLIVFFAVYAYLVEIINVNEISFEQDALLYRKRPLPWFFSRRRIPLARIERIIPELTEDASSRGPETRSSVAVRHPDGDATTLFFTNSFSEAKAIAGLTNRHLRDYYGFVIPTVLDQNQENEEKDRI